MKILIDKIEAKKAVISIIGMGYVGLPLAMEFANLGYRVIGIDNDKKKVSLLNKGISYIQDVPSEILKKNIKKSFFHATDDYSVIKKVDTVSICVPTPLGKTKDPDLSFVMSSVELISKYVHRGLLIVLESTTYPGTTRELLLPEFEKKGFKAGKDIFLAFSPERVDPGNTVYTTKNTPKIVGGITKECTKIASLLYGKVIDTIVPVSTTETAELVKLLENTFRSVNIGMANELAIMCDKLGVNVWEVIEAAGTKPFGFMKFYPGPGLGGHCIPVDPHYLSWKLKTLNYRARFIELAGEVNSEMPEFVVKKVINGLNNIGKSVKNSKILIVGVAYKKNIDDVRESPALDIINLLLGMDGKISYIDPYVSELRYDGGTFKSLKPNQINRFDCSIIVTDHGNIDYNVIIKNSAIVVDCRNAMKGMNAENIIRL